MARKIPTSILVGGIAFLLAASACVWASFVPALNGERKKTYPTVIADIVQIEEVYETNYDEPLHSPFRTRVSFYWLNLRYSVDGKEYTAKLQARDGRRLRTELLYYNPGDPAQVHLEENVQSNGRVAWYAFAVVLALLGAAAIRNGFLMGGNNRKRKKKRRKRKVRSSV